MLTLRHTPRDGTGPQLRHALLGLLGGLGALGCGADADSPKQDLGDGSQSNGSLEPNEGFGSLTDQGWGCLGRAPLALPAPRTNTVVGFVLPVVDWARRAPLAGRGLTATLCSTVDFRCVAPVATPYSVRDGMLGSTPLPPGATGVPVLEGFEGFIRFELPAADGAPESQRFIPASYYLGGIVSGDLSEGLPVLLLRHADRDIVLQQSFPSFDPALAAQTGMVITTVLDCAQAVKDARVEITVAGGAVRGMTRFLLPDSRIPIEVPAGQPLVTGASGVVGFLGLPPGALQLRAFRQGDAKPFATLELGSVAGELSVGPLRPAFSNSANVFGYYPVDSN